MVRYFHRKPTSTEFETLSDPCILTRGITEQYSIVSVHADHCLIASASQQELQRIQHEMQRKFKIKDLGEASSLLGLTTNHDGTEGDARLAKCIAKCIAMVLKRFNMEGCQVSRHIHFRKDKRKCEQERNE